MSSRVKFDELFGFGADLGKWNALFGDIRAEGYAMALIGGFVSRVRIFCPEIEFGPMREKIMAFGADGRSVCHQETLATTYHNGISMRATIGTLDLKDDKVCLSSSIYHRRSDYFAHQRHDFEIVSIPVDAFIFAATPISELGILFDRLISIYGNSPLTLLTLDDAKGIGDDLAGRYKLPPQPTKQK